MVVILFLDGAKVSEIDREKEREGARERAHMHVLTHVQPSRPDFSTLLLVSTMKKDDV